jgi:hypothetical protein
MVAMPRSHALIMDPSMAMIYVKAEGFDEVDGNRVGVKKRREITREDMKRKVKKRERNERKLSEGKRSGME